MQELGRGPMLVGAGNGWQLDTSNSIYLLLSHRHWRCEPDISIGTDLTFFLAPCDTMCVLSPLISRQKIANYMYSILLFQKCLLWTFGNAGHFQVAMCSGTCSLSSLPFDPRDRRRVQFHH